MLALRRAVGNRAFGALARSGALQRQPVPSTTPPLAKGSTMYWPGTEPKDPPPPTPTLFERPSSQNGPAGAKAALEEYRKLTAAERKKAFEGGYAKGAVTIVLNQLGPGEAETTFAAEVRELGRFAQELETRKMSGMTDAEMAKVEAKWLHEKHKKAAEAAAASSGKTVTDADIEAARKKAEQQQSYYKPMAKTRYDAMSPAQRTAWDKRAVKAIDKIVAHAAAAHPELKLTAAQLVWDPNAIDSNAPGALGQGRGPGTATVGFEFVEVVEVNPAYAMSTVVHELFGHPEYDAPGTDPNYHWALFKLAGAQMPGYTADPTAEGASYNYHESEIYSLLRELPYWTAVSAKDSKWASVNYDPRQGVGWQLDSIKEEWEPKLAAALVRGLYQRFRLDPRISWKALSAFSDVVKTKFPAEHAEIVK